MSTIVTTIPPRPQSRQTILYMAKASNMTTKPPSEGQLISTKFINSTAPTITQMSTTSTATPFVTNTSTTTPITSPAPPKESSKIPIILGLLCGQVVLFLVAWSLRHFCCHQRQFEAPIYDQTYSISPGSTSSVGKRCSYSTLISSNSLLTQSVPPPAYLILDCPLCGSKRESIEMDLFENISPMAHKGSRAKEQQNATTNSSIQSPLISAAGVHPNSASVLSHELSGLICKACRAIESCQEYSAKERAILMWKKPRSTIQSMDQVIAELKTYSDEDLYI